MTTTTTVTAAASKCSATASPALVAQLTELANDLGTVFAGSTANVASLSAFLGTLSTASATQLAAGNMVLGNAENENTILSQAITTLLLIFESLNVKAPTSI